MVIYKVPSYLSFESSSHFFKSIHNSVIVISITIEETEQVTLLGATENLGGSLDTER